MKDITLTEETREEIVNLAGAMREGTIEDIEVVRLDQLLCECPGAVELYTELALLTSDLKDLSGCQYTLQGVPHSDADKVQVKKKNTFISPAFLLAAAAILAIAFFISFKEKIPARGTDVASVNAALGTEFVYGGRNGEEITSGKQIQSGYYQLKNGILELNYTNGAAVIIEGPANFSLKNDMQLNLESGSLSADIPESAKGFTVLTSAAKVVDLGTEFSVKASEFQSEVHVFKGEVVVEPTKKSDTAESHHLFENQASRIDVNSSLPVGIDAKPDDFLRSLDEPKHVYPGIIKSLSPIAYYRMRPTQSGVLKDMYKNNGRYIHYPGRKSAWAPGKFGAAFRCEGPGVFRYARVNNFPVTDNDRFSIVTWILAESRPRRATIANIGDDNGLFNFGLYRRSGELKGHIGSITGKLIVVKSQNPITLNKWIHAALTADGSTLKLYINGNLEAETGYSSTDFDPLKKTLTIGAITGSKGRARSNWDGRIDELAVFDYALETDEIQKLYMQNH